jgi:hypothetical protein
MERYPCMDATQQAWSIYLRRNAAIAPEDGLRCSLERFVRERWHSGENDLDDLTCSGLAFLSRVPSSES